MPSNSDKWSFVIVAVLALFLQAFESPISDETILNTEQPMLEDQDNSEQEDPFEPLNRGFFAINELLDGLFFKPAAYAFRDLLAEPVQDAIANFFDNLSSPVTLINDLLQAEGEKAGETFTRFCINSTVGLLGFFDVAAEWWDIQPHKTDFGMTLRSYDITSGPYLFIPLIGPSTFVDALGRVVDYFIDPFNIVMIKNDYDWVTFARAGAQGVITRAKVLPITENIDKTSDPYSQYRIYYIQNRNSMVKGENRVGRESPVPAEIIKAE